MGGNLLVLDEPTNHLDIGAREALEEVLNEYNGTILFVSHDRYFIDAVADTIWMVENGSIEAFDGTYSEYAAFQQAKDRKPAADERRATTDDQRDKDDEGPKARQPRSKLPDRPMAMACACCCQWRKGKPSIRSPIPSPQPPAPSKDDRRLRRKLVALEEEIAMLEAEMKQLAEEMTSASAQADGKRVKSLEMQYSDVQEMLNTRYDEWSAVAG